MLNNIPAILIPEFVPVMKLSRWVKMTFYSDASQRANISRLAKQAPVTLIERTLAPELILLPHHSGLRLTS